MPRKKAQPGKHRKNVGAVEKAKRLRKLQKQGTINRRTAFKWFWEK